MFGVMATTMIAQTMPPTCWQLPVPQCIQDDLMKHKPVPAPVPAPQPPPRPAK